MDSISNLNNFEEMYKAKLSLKDVLGFVVMTQLDLTMLCGIFPNLLLSNVQISNQNRDHEAFLNSMPSFLVCRSQLEKIHAKSKTERYSFLFKPDICENLYFIFNMRSQLMFVHFILKVKLI